MQALLPSTPASRGGHRRTSLKSGLGGGPGQPDSAAAWKALRPLLQLLLESSLEPRQPLCLRTPAEGPGMGVPYQPPHSDAREV